MDQTIRKYLDVNLTNTIIIIDEGHNIASEAESCQTKEFDNKDFMLFYIELKMLNANIEYYKKNQIERNEFTLLESNASDYDNVYRQLL